MQFFEANNLYLFQAKLKKSSLMLNFETLSASKQRF